FTPVADVRRTLTPELARGDGDTLMLLLDLAGGRLRLGGSCVGQSYGEYGGESADLDDPAKPLVFIVAARAPRDRNLVLAYHDRSDGGLFATLAGMAFASRMGLEITVPPGVDLLGWLFAEEPGAVIEVRAQELPAVTSIHVEHGLAGDAHPVAGPTS